MKLVIVPCFASYNLIIGALMLFKYWLIIKLCCFVNTINFRTELVKLCIHCTAITVAAGSVHRFESQLIHAMQHTGYPIHCSIGNLHKRNTVLCIGRSLPESPDQPSHFFGNRKPCRIVCGSVDPIPRRKLFNCPLVIPGIYLQRIISVNSRQIMFNRQHILFPLSFYSI